VGINPPYQLPSGGSGVYSYKLNGGGLWVQPNVFQSSGWEVILFRFEDFQGRLSSKALPNNESKWNLDAAYRLGKSSQGTDCFLWN